MFLSLARGIFEEQQHLDSLVERIMLEAQDMLKCERCSVYLVEDVLEGVRRIVAAVHQQCSARTKPSCYVGFVLLGLSQSEISDWKFWFWASWV